MQTAGTTGRWKNTKVKQQRHSAAKPQPKDSNGKRMGANESKSFLCFHSCAPIRMPARFSRRDSICLPKNLRRTRRCWEIALQRRDFSCKSFSPFGRSADLQSAEEFSNPRHRRIVRQALVSAAGIRIGNGQRIANPRYGRIQFYAALVAAPPRCVFASVVQKLPRISAVQLDGQPLARSLDF